MDTSEFELPPHGLELLDEARHRPERGVVRAVGLTAAELVVKNDLPAIVRELAEADEVTVIGARAAVQPDERHLAAPVAPAEDLVTCVVDDEPCLLDFFAHRTPSSPHSGHLRNLSRQCWSRTVSSFGSALSISWSTA